MSFERFNAVEAEALQTAVGNRRGTVMRGAPPESETRSSRQGSRWNLGDLRLPAAEGGPGLVREGEELNPDRKVSVGTAGAQDADAGKKVFNQCRACHVLDKSTNRVGLHLGGVIGRKAGSVEGFSYSDAIKNSGITWDEESLSKYLKDPKAAIPGNKMAFAGVKKDDDLKNLIAYLKEESDK